jgi:hypothetical protein
MTDTLIKGTGKKGSDPFSQRKRGLTPFSRK